MNMYIYVYATRLLIIWGKGVRGHQPLGTQRFTRNNHQLLESLGTPILNVSRDDTVL